MRWTDARAALEGRRLPAALVDLDALARNVDRLLARVPSPTTLRVATKSVRHVGLLRRILERGGARCRGLMCFSVEEAVRLADAGFDDLLVAYPTVQRAGLEALARRAARGKRVCVVADCGAHLEALGAAGRAAGATLGAVLEIDLSYRAVGGRLHLGVRRSPLRTAADCAALARRAAAIEGVSIVGLMGYEAHVAGLTDRAPAGGRPLAARRAFKRVATPAAARLRAEAAEALSAAGVDLRVVNGGGTGSLHLTAAQPALTEVTAGSGFLCPHLFSDYVDLDLEPAAFFALEVCRVSDPGYVTCAGGGYVASGPAAEDRQPRPWSPVGLSLVPTEGAGEVQTPLRLPPGARPLAIGDPVLFRHAKAGELAERFARYLLVEAGRVVADEPTYRGEGWCFF
ncbi:MAG: alanine racemase [Myxococcales bacterium]|nr:alanine racemase [Myxococcales bacterium]